jgi:GDP/UDP-N,N'-diacetylbacillosamine 2-epimerase (hydrolysing)
MKIGVLTSSRADFGIYLPLLGLLKIDTFFKLEIIAFGTHLSQNHGFTLNEIENIGFDCIHKISSLISNDDEQSISSSYGLTVLKFSDFWQNNAYDLVLCLGDRFEMSAAVQAGIPYQVKFAHLHAGEKTLGAIDEIYRHQISLAAELHFVSIEEYAKRIHKLLGKNDTTCVTGAIGLENLKKIQLLNLEEFRLKWDIDLAIPTLFFIVHPETKNFSTNILHAEVLQEVSLELSKEYQVVVSLPNSDTNGSVYREMWKEVNKTNPTIKLIEHFGTQSFFTCMKYSRLVIGNSSSAILEAASFQKYVLNLGCRQMGRVTGDNVIHLPFNTTEILSHVKKYKNQDFHGANIMD